MRRDYKKRNQSNQHDEMNFDMQSKQEVNRINLTIWISMFILFAILQILLGNYEGKVIKLRGISFNTPVFSGIIAQGQVMLSVGMVLIPLKRSYIIVLGLNLVNAISITRVILFEGATDAIPGLLICLSTMIVVTIISKYGKNLTRQILKVTQQKEQLIQYNQIMKDNEVLLHHMAYYDGLTELPNRKMMIDKLNSLTNSVEASQVEFVFVFIDFDNFKAINDYMGHSVGDDVLKKVVKRWLKLVQVGDMLARFGGDEFALLICRKLTENELFSYISNYKEVLLDAIHINQKDLHVSISCGITKYPQDGNNTMELLKNADIALYMVKNNGKNGLRFYNEEMQENVRKRIKIENGLRSAIQNNELFVVFQPLYVTESRKLRGFEVLVRWNSTELGEVAPDQFIPIAEETGSIIEIGEWIMRSSLKIVKTLQEICSFDLIISINISVVQMMEPDFIIRVKRVIEEIDFDSKYLEFEITESIFISYPEHFIGVLNALRALGIRISLDDFGTGYASLSYLHMLPIDTLKIDKSFIDKITFGKDKKQIVGTIIELAHQLELKVVAEGVEQELQMDYLIEKKCDYMQGYLFSKPLTEEKLKQLLIQTIK